MFSQHHFCDLGTLTTAVGALSVPRTLSSEAGALAPNSEALRLETTCSGYNMEIVSVLAKNASEDVIKRVKKSLRIKRKNIVITWNFSHQLD
jgi:hypothetical protein